MNSRLSVWFPAGLVFLLAALTFWLDRVVQPPGAQRDGSHRHDPDYWVDNFTATRLGPDGQPQYVLVAKRMTHYPDDDSTHLVKPHLTRYAKGLPPMRIESQIGQVSKDGEHAWFSGEVKVTREAGRGQSELTVTTPYLHVIPDKDFAETNREVAVRSGGTWVTAVGMEFNSKTRIIRFLSRVKGQHVKTK